MNEDDVSPSLNFSMKFKNIDMNALKNKKITPPFRPPINGEMDVSNFSSDFTDLTPIDSPSQPVKSNGLFKVRRD